METRALGGSRLAALGAWRRGELIITRFPKMGGVVRKKVRDGSAQRLSLNLALGV